MPQMTKFKLAGTLVLAGSLALAGCTKKAPAALPPAPEPTTSAAPAPAVSGPTPGSQADFAAQMMGQDTIYFDTDKYDVDQTDATALRAQAVWLARYPGKRVTLEGHCDERGTREYNLALGQRRANAARDLLVGNGVAGGRLRTVSYGKDRPAELGSDEQAWARNRRAVTTVQ